MVWQWTPSFWSSQIDGEEQPGANVIEDEIANIEHEIADIEQHKDMVQHPDFESNSRKYVLIMWDLETTGCQPQRIVQIGAWEMFTNCQFERLANPGKLCLSQW